jgi:hypothetical protein
MKRRIVTGLLVVAGTLVVALAGCNGNSTSSTPPSPVFTPVPFLVPGTTYNFSGKYSEAITYASPNPKQPNSIGTYTTTDVQTVASAPPGAPAPFHIHRQFKYSVIKVPTSGIQLQSRTIDAYESSTVNGDSQTIAQASTTTANTGIDQTANRIEGNGPYSYTSTNATTYASPRVLFVFPLTESTTNVPIARTETLVELAKNSSGQIYVQRNTKSVYANSGAFTTTGSIGKGETTDVTANANGSATVTNQGSAPFMETIGLPVANGGTYTIPITRTTGTVTQKYSAADWYPGNAAPPSPLASASETVVGPAAVPTACGLTSPVSGAVEVTGSSSTLNVVAGTYTTTQSATYLANNQVVCRMTSSKILTYTVETGALFSTTIDAFVEGLTSTTKS